MNRKTVTILGVAGGLVAAASILGAQRSSPKTVTTTTVKSTQTAPLAPTDPVKPPVNLLSCDGAPSRAPVDLGVGTMDLALSSSKVLAAGPGEIFAVVDLVAKETQGKRPPISVAIVLDRSGSMAGDAIGSARAAATGIVDRLGDNDRVALITYNTQADVIVDLTYTDAAGKARLEKAIAEIYAGGGTDVNAGMQSGVAEVLRGLEGSGVNRVILMTDGITNHGEVNPQKISSNAEDAADRGVRITTIGFGEKYDEDLMQSIAEYGRGHYYYAKDTSQLEPVFAGELGAIQATVATSATLRLEPTCGGVEIAEVYGYVTKRDGAAVIVPLADLAGGDHRKVVVRLTVPTDKTGSEGALAATFGYTATSGEAKQASVRVGVEVSTDAQAVEASIDRDVMAKVEQIEVARTMRAAAEAYDKGEVDSANQMIEAQRASTAKHKAQYQLDDRTLAPAVESLGAMSTAVNSAAPATPEGKAAKKASKSDAYLLEQ